MSEVSVVIPVYNAGEKLRHCLRSVLGQSQESIEIIIVNDGSTDDSRAICSEFALQDDRIRLVDQTRSGSIAARRVGVELATAPYITFVDADDWLDAEMVERLQTAITLHDADIAVCNSYRVTNGPISIKRVSASCYFGSSTVYRGTSVREELVTSFLHGHSFPASLHGKLYRSELVKRCGTYLNRLTFFGDDLYYNLEMFLQAGTVAVIPEPLYYYRAGGLTSRYMPELLSDVVAGYRVQRSIIEAYFPPDEREKHYIGINLMLLNMIRTCLRNLFLVTMKREERHAAIAALCLLPEIMVCAHHEPSAGQLQRKFIRAVREGDIDYLHRVGRALFRRQRLRNWLLNPFSAIDSIKFDKLRSKFLKSGDTKRQHLRSR